jgi:hypothetical protein
MGKVKIHLEGEVSLSDYKRMRKVVCKTSEEEFERDFQESFEKESEGNKMGTFPKEYFCVRVAEIYCCVGGRIVRIRTVYTIGRRARFSRHFVGTKIEVV